MKLRTSRIVMALLIALVLMSCTLDQRLPPAPVSEPSMPSAMHGVLKSPRFFALGRAYEGGKPYDPSRPDLILSSTNLFTDVQSITFLPGEMEKRVTLTARDSFVWKDALSVKRYSGQSDFNYHPLELNGVIPDYVKTAGLRWIEKESFTTLTITRGDLNTAPPFHDPTNPEYAGYHGYLQFLVHTQPGAGNTIFVKERESSVWLITTLWYRAYNDADESPQACVGANKWIDSTKCCGDDTNEFAVQGSTLGSLVCCPVKDSLFVDGQCVAPSSGASNTAPTITTTGTTSGPTLVFSDIPPPMPEEAPE